MPYKCPYRDFHACLGTMALPVTLPDGFFSVFMAVKLQIEVIE
jgi:hypothetical protein